MVMWKRIAFIMEEKMKIEMHVHISEGSPCAKADAESIVKAYSQDGYDAISQNFMIGEFVKIIVDRPLGSCHPEHKDIYYPVNYGYVEGIMAPDGEEQDAYILGVHTTVNEFTGKVIAIIHRYDDIEEKWVVAPEGMSFSKEEIIEQVNFQEQYFKYEIKM